MSTPHDYDDDNMIDDSTEEYIFEVEYEPADVILCPRCEMYEMPAGREHCWRCADEIWIHNNG